MLAKVGELSSSYASLIGKHAAGVPKALLESRQAVSREKQLLASVSRAEKCATEAKAKVEAAVVAEAEAEERACMAEELQAKAARRARTKQSRMQRRRLRPRPRPRRRFRTRLTSKPF